jgi:hypothetical protein
MGFAALYPSYVRVTPRQILPSLFLNPENYDRQRETFARLESRKSFEISLAANALFWHANCWLLIDI